MSKALYLIIGGFLGAGKTTAIRRIARHLANRGLRVGLITNDQSHGLVDTALLRTEEFPVEEITGGCFCCRFNSLIDASEKLSAGGRPDVFIAEPVGSCTDLVATVSFPLRRIYGEAYRVAPLSVLVDPIRAERMIGLESGRNFSRRVLYVYAKQLEEAGAIVINKCDLISPARQDRLEAALRRAYGRSGVYRVSARAGSGIEHWIDSLIAGGGGAESAPDLDYELYAEGEALLGWLNASVSLRADRGVDGNELLRTLALSIREALGRFEIAHLKMTLVPAEEAGDIGVINLVRTDAEPEVSHSLKAPLAAGVLLINLRAEAEPELLRQSVADALAGCGCQAEIERVECFHPSKPRPTHRMDKRDSGAGDPPPPLRGCGETSRT
jgi:G3E family GTPase